MTYWVYILTSKPGGTLYIGVTNDLQRRVGQHRSKRADGFTSRCNITRLVYYETTDDVREAIAREKQIKGWTRARKIELVESVNVEWEDLGECWFAAEEDSSLRSE